MMKKQQILSVAAVVALALTAQTASAQLIDYSRRNRTPARPAQARTAQKPASTYGTSMTANNSAQGVNGTYEVKTRFEKKYDLNRDGKLTGKEVRALLADTVKEVESEGRAVVISYVLEQYDVNGDGYISQYEVTAINKALGR